MEAVLPPIGVTAVAAAVAAKGGGVLPPSPKGVSPTPNCLRRESALLRGGGSQPLLPTGYKGEEERIEYTYTQRGAAAAATEEEEEGE